MAKKFYAIQKLPESQRADIYIFGEICQWAYPEYGEADALTIKDEINGLDVAEIHLHIDSVGGSVKEAWGIYNVLRQHPAKIISHADGFVASAALYPFLAGDERLTTPLAAFFLHEVMTYADGYADDLRAAADEAEKLTDIGINAFVERAGMDADKVRELMEAETWLSPEEALSYGIATGTEEAGEAGNAAQSARLQIFKRMFENQKKEEKTPAQPEKIENAIMKTLSGIF